jgi:hypothetical protein
MPDRDSKTLCAGLRELIGLQLSSVEFVHDYIQLHFDGPTLTAYTWPTVAKRSSVILSWNQNGYRDAICEQIGCSISEIECQPKSLALMFETDAVVRISLSEDAYRGPEAIQLSLSEDRTWVV